MSPITDPRQMASLSASYSAVSRRLLLALTILALATITLLAGCAGTRGGPVPYNVENFQRPDTPTALTLEDDYKIGPLDTLTIKVFQVPDLSGEFPVDLTGHIAIPLLGDIKAVDLTTAELDQRLTQQLGVKYLQRPDVSVAVKASTRRNVTVDGSVRTPGMYSVPGPMSLIQVIAMANGTTEDSNPRRVAVFRQIKGERMAAAFDLTDIRRGKAKDPTIYAGDIIVVDGSRVKAVQREILQTIPIAGFFYSFIF